MEDYDPEIADHQKRVALLAYGIGERAHEKALTLLRGNLDKLALLANTLLERETLDGDEMDRVLRGEKLEPIQRVESGPNVDTPVAPPALICGRGGNPGGPRHF